MMRRLLLACLTACGSFGTTSSSPSEDGGTSTDAGNLLDGGGTDGSSECVKRSRFTDPFERSNGKLVGEWNNYAYDKGTLSIDNISPLRDGASLKADLSAGPTSTAMLTKTLPTGTCPVFVSFVFKPKGFPTGVGAQGAIVYLDYGIGELELRLLENHKFAITDDPDTLSSEQFELPFENVVDEVAAVSLVFDTKTKRVEYTLQRGGAAPVNGVVTFKTDYGQPSEAAFGAHKVQTSAPFAYFLDNLVIE